MRIWLPRALTPAETMLLRHPVSVWPGWFRLFDITQISGHTVFGHFQTGSRTHLESFYATHLWHAQDSLPIPSVHLVDWTLPENKQLRAPELLAAGDRLLYVVPRLDMR